MLLQPPRTAGDDREPDAGLRIETIVREIPFVPVGTGEDARVVGTPKFDREIGSGIPPGSFSGVRRLGQFVFLDEGTA